MAGDAIWEGDGTGSVICCSIALLMLVPSLSSSQKVASPFCKDIAEVEEVPLPPLFIRRPSHAAIAFSRHNFYNGLARLCLSSSSFCRSRRSFNGYSGDKILGTWLSSIPIDNYVWIGLQTSSVFSSSFWNGSICRNCLNH